MRAVQVHSISSCESACVCEYNPGIRHSMASDLYRADSGMPLLNKYLWTFPAFLFLDALQDLKNMFELMGVIYLFGDTRCRRSLVFIFA